MWRNEKLVWEYWESIEFLEGRDYEFTRGSKRVDCEYGRKIKWKRKNRERSWIHCKRESSNEESTWWASREYLQIEGYSFIKRTNSWREFRKIKKKWKWTQKNFARKIRIGEKVKLMPVENIRTWVEIGSRKKTNRWSLRIVVLGRIRTRSNEG